jgi:hypothetical protein
MTSREASAIPIQNINFDINYLTSSPSCIIRKESWFKVLGIAINFVQLDAWVDYKFLNDVESTAAFLS